MLTKAGISCKGELGSSGTFKEGLRFLPSLCFVQGVFGYASDKLPPISSYTPTMLSENLGVSYHLGQITTETGSGPIGLLIKLPTALYYVDISGVYHGEIFTRVPLTGMGVVTKLSRWREKFEGLDSWVDNIYLKVDMSTVTPRTPEEEITPELLIAPVVREAEILSQALSEKFGFVGDLND